jgi:RNA recognition motif-containing protein
MTEVSSTRLYLGNLPRAATKADIESHFAAHGTGEITEVKLMNGFGFIEYKDPMDARDVVPAFHGSDFMGERMTVQFARGTRQRENAYGERAAPRPRRTSHRMQISGLPPETSWQVCLLSPSPPFCFSFRRRTTYFPGPVSSSPPVPIPVPWSYRCALLCE